MTADIRQAARRWFESHWDPDLTVREWWRRLFDGGWTVPTWPEECYGRGVSGGAAKAIREERIRVGAASGPGGMGLMLAGPTLVAHGTPEQQRHHLPPLLRGEMAWCQLFSEPEAGSDLAGLRTTAKPDGDGWIVTGQKVWSSGAQHADLGMLLARTDDTVPKHKGITWFVLDMNQPGIEIRPIREMTGRALFNEVFIDGVHVGPDAVVGGLGNGWAVANTTLGAERSALGGGSDAASGVVAGKKGGMLDRRAGSLGEGRRDRSGTAALIGGRTADMLIRLAQERQVASDATLRQRLADLWILERIAEYTALRIRAAARAGRRPAAETSTQKLHMSKMVRATRDVGLTILGPDGTLAGPESATAGVVQEMALFSPAPSIYGGTDEIQRNIVAERVLGLPREPNPDATRPFNQRREQPS